MCDYCDCRTRPLLVQLGVDHERIGVVVRQFRTAADAGDRKERARELRALLDSHSRIEEAALYPELARVGLPTDALEAEHAAVDAALDAAVADVATEWTQVTVALEGLEDHIHREEYDLFPAAHQMLDDAAWDRMDVVAG